MIRSKRRLWIEADGLHIRKKVEQKIESEERLKHEKSIYSFEGRSEHAESVDDL